LELVNKNRLDKHEKLLINDFAKLNYPIKNWVPTTLGPDEKPLIDVLIVGGGMNGLAAAFALRAQGIQNIRQVDQQPIGYAGPWLNFARMEYLRSPKHLTGPTLNIPNLTYRAWWEATNSEHKWQDIGFIKRENWASYLSWFEKVTNTILKSRILKLGPL
jgi:cation diffusion facilitator CzcD-associated flavoprotein CzcO